MTTIQAYSLVIAGMMLQVSPSFAGTLTGAIKRAEQVSPEGSALIKQAEEALDKLAKQGRALIDIEESASGTTKVIYQNTPNIVQKTMVHPDSSVTQIKFPVPKSNLPAKEVKSVKLAFAEESGPAGRLRNGDDASQLSHSELYESAGIYRKYETAKGDVVEQMSFSVVTDLPGANGLPGKSMRVQEVLKIDGPEISLIAKKIQVGTDEAIKINLRNSFKRSGKTQPDIDAVLPLNSQFGKVLGWNFSRDASYLVTWTADGHKVKYQIVSDGLRGLKVDRGTSVASALDVSDYYAITRHIPARSPVTGPAGGMDVDTAAGAATK